MEADVADEESLEEDSPTPDVVPPTDDPGSPTAEVAPRRPRRLAVILLSIALVIALVALGGAIALLTIASSRIDEQQKRIDEQTDLIEKKETFGAAMEQLLDTAAAFEGTLTASIVPLDEYQRVARSAWAHRWSSGALDRDIDRVQASQRALETRLANAVTEASTNASGTTYESVIDSLGAGHVTSLIDDADTLCESDVLACVLNADPYSVHFDGKDNSLPYMTDWIRTGIAYHEFAHVLQITNPEPTETALVAFGGDSETMADCFALTFLPGWTLDHTVWVSSYQYYEASIGYGYTCDAGQAQVVRDWYAELGVRLTPITQ